MEPAPAKKGPSPVIFTHKPWGQILYKKSRTKRGALEDFGRGEILSRHFDIVLASSGLDAARWRGRGDVIWFCLESSSTIGASGQYDWAGTDGLLLYDGGISFDFNATTETGMWIYAD